MKVSAKYLVAGLYRIVTNSQGELYAVQKLHPITHNPHGPVILLKYLSDEAQALVRHDFEKEKLAQTLVANGDVMAANLINQ